MIVASSLTALLALGAPLTAAKPAPVEEPIVAPAVAETSVLTAGPLPALPLPDEEADVVADAGDEETIPFSQPTLRPYGPARFADETGSIGWRFGGAAAAITVTGVLNWDWGSAPFSFKDEGFFGKDTSNLGMDKMGHGYTAYVLTDFFADGIEKAHPETAGKPYTAALLSMALMTYIEVFDGFSKDHGFSNQDLVADGVGALLAVGRRAAGLEDKIDFRLLYKPDERAIRALGCLPEPVCEEDGAKFRSPITDYSNQRYLMALKLSGFEGLKDTPLRLVELHAGYYGRGFTREEKAAGDPLRRELFVGLGLNVAELIWPNGRSTGGKIGRAGLEYLQLPYTAVHSE